MSLDSVSSAATKELENDHLRLEKKNLEEEIGRIGKHLEEIRRESSLVQAAPPPTGSPNQALSATNCLTVFPVAYLASLRKHKLLPC